MAKRTVTFIMVGDSDELDREIELPATREVCPVCEGVGTHVNEAIDGNGISGEEWERDWDDESRETYFGGGYDVVCTKCNGDRVVDVIDEAECRRLGLGKELAAYHAAVREDSEYDALCRSERRMGA